MTPAELLILKNAIDADPVLSALPHTSDDALAIVAAMSVPTADFMVWQTSMPAQTIFDAITWANLTPTDAPDGTALWTNRSLACQGKQFNLQTILSGRETINPAKANIRAGLQDALTSVPSGANGALKSGGWANVQTAMQRKATRGEKLFATGTGTAASPATMTIEGALSYLDVEAARAL
jgi:hypothetical protein